MRTTDEAAPAARSGRDLLTGAILVAAILLFVGVGSLAVGDIVRLLSGTPVTGDTILTVALVLNLALILLAWRRQRNAVRLATAPGGAATRSHLPGSRDAVTGLSNHRTFAEECAALIVAADQRGRAVAVLVLELDDSAVTIDQAGSAGHGALLRQVAATLADLPPGALLARIGPASFACALVFDPAVPDVVQRTAEQLLARLARPLEVQGRPAAIPASIGIARSDRASANVDSLVGSARAALAVARRSGRNRLAWFDPAMEEEERARAVLERDLRRAIDAGEVVPWFEPQVALADGRLTGFEVLARWQHPRLGVLTPDRFISVAVESGLIADLSLSVIRQALLAARDWDPSLTISVNLAVPQLRDAWLAQKLIKLLGETGFPAGRLQVELTESALVDNLPLARSIADSLKNQGVTLALDDFGTGLSSLAHLRALPFDTVKIDTRFVLSMGESPESAAIVTAIAGLGDSLNLPITAEGVETQAAEERLRALGITRAQGWRYGKPMPVTAARRLLAEKRLLAAPDDRLRNRRLAG